jgi:CubicO group peptidase (beta-lactamase class C family)
MTENRSRSGSVSCCTPIGVVSCPPAAPCPIATLQAGALPDLTGVTPLLLKGERLASFAAYVSEKIAAASIPGAAIAIVQGGAVVFLEGFGVRQLGRCTTVPPPGRPPTSPAGSR